MLVRPTRAVVVMMSAVALLGSPAPAAASWSPPTPELSILLGYGAAYAGCTHRGVDLRARTGESVCTPVEGTVSFAGRVPADGGGTCQAVTIETADGLRVSLMPLAESWVSQGASVRAGDQVGACAALGDSSSEVTHLHLSARRGEAYLDPTGLLTAPAATSCQPEASSALPSEDTPAPPISSGTAASSATVAAPTVAASAPVAQPAAGAVSQTAAASQRSVRMPRDAQEQSQLMLHSAPSASIMGFRLPSVSATPSALFAALALAVMAMLLAVLVRPRHALDRT